MGYRDQRLVHELGIPVQQLAKVLAKSRQTVNRGIKKPDAEYFKPADLITALNVWRTSNAGLYAVARTKIRQIYPELADALLDASSANSATFSAEVPGEYWLICGDLLAFKNGLPRCAEELDALCALDTAQVKLIVNGRDKRIAHRYEIRFKEKYTAAVICQNMDLRIMSTTLLRISMDDSVDLFGVSDAGFTPLSRQEAMRLRVAFDDILLDSMNANRVLVS